MKLLKLRQISDLHPDLDLKQESEGVADGGGSRRRLTGEWPPNCGGVGGVRGKERGSLPHAPFGDRMMVEKLTKFPIRTGEGVERSAGVVGGEEVDSSGCGSDGGAGLWRTGRNGAERSAGVVELRRFEGAEVEAE